MKQKLIAKSIIVCMVTMLFSITVSAQSAINKDVNGSLQSKEYIQKMEYYKSVNQTDLKYQAKKLEMQPATRKLIYSGNFSVKPSQAIPLGSRKEVVEHLRQVAVENGRPTEKYDLELKKLANQSVNQN